MISKKSRGADNIKLILDETTAHLLVFILPYFAVGSTTDNRQHLVNIYLMMRLDHLNNLTFIFFLNLLLICSRTIMFS